MKNERRKRNKFIIILIKCKKYKRKPIEKNQIKRRKIREEK